MTKIFFRILVWGVIILFLLLTSIVKLIPEPISPDADIYKATIQGIREKGAVKTTSASSVLKVGWSKKTLFDGNKHPMGGYGIRIGATFEKVCDTVWVRTIFFDNDEAQAVYVSLDLLITPPLVLKRVEEKLESLGLAPEQLFITATHGHSSLGGWQKGLMGRLMSGPYEEETVSFIVSQVVSSIREAQRSVSLAKMSTKNLYMPGLVRNRLVKNSTAKTDPWLKVIRMTNEKQQEAYITSFSAHPTCYKHTSYCLSADYPGALCTTLEADSTIDFALFGAGAMASMTTVAPKNTGEERVDYMADALSQQILSNREQMLLDSTREISYFSAPILLPTPTPKLNHIFALRSWVFRSIVGTPSPQVTSLKIGNTLFVGLPCDFSGELSKELYDKAKEKGMFLVINGFNGDYIGYVTKDEWYNEISHAETELMNWYGPGMGAYFSEIITTVIDAY